MEWGVGSSSVVGVAGNTYSMSSDAAFDRSRTKVMRLVPRACGRVTLKVAIMGLLLSGAEDTFTLYRAPGSRPNEGSLAPTQFSCTLQSLASTCEVQGNLNIDEWDALEMVWQTNGVVVSTGAPVAVSLACN
jgi:hypothetical protein